MKKYFLLLAIFIAIFLQIFMCFPANAQSTNIDEILEDFDLNKETNFQTINQPQKADSLSNKDSIEFDELGNLKSIFRTNLLSEKYNDLRTTKAISADNLMEKTDSLISKGLFLHILY